MRPHVRDHHAIVVGPTANRALVRSLLDSARQRGWTTTLVHSSDPDRGRPKGVFLVGAQHKEGGLCDWARSHFLLSASVGGVHGPLSCRIEAIAEVERLPALVAAAAAALDAVMAESRESRRVASEGGLPAARRSGYDVEAVVAHLSSIVPRARPIAIRILRARLAGRTTSEVATLVQRSRTTVARYFRDDFLQPLNARNLQDLLASVASATLR